nr:hypothetical protein [Sulfobacillus thermotolerans]
MMDHTTLPLRSDEISGLDDLIQQLFGDPLAEVVLDPLDIPPGAE